MRIFLTIMIFAVAFSGFAAATHAFEMDGSTASMDCHAPQPDDNQGDKEVGSKCHDCCLTNGVFTSVSVFPALQIAHSVKPFEPNQPTDNWLFSLLRPPRTLV